MKSFQTALAVFVCSLALTAATKFKDCGSKDGTIKSVTVSGCGDVDKCVFARGTNVSFEMDFTANKDISDANTVVTAYLGPIHVNFKLDDPKSCDFMSCPIAKGNSGVYKQSLPIKTSYPAVSVKVQWRLMMKDEVITCFQINAELH